MNNCVGCMEKFLIFSCCVLIGVQIKRHILNGFPDSGGPPGFKLLFTTAWSSSAQPVNMNVACTIDIFGFVYPPCVWFQSSN